MPIQDSLRSTRIVVGQDRFQIQTDLSEEELQAIASYVDGKLAIHLSPNARDPRKQLVLMAMDIASELFVTRHRLEELEKFRNETLLTANRLNALFEEPSEPASRPLPAGDRSASAQVFLD